MFQTLLQKHLGGFFQRGRDESLKSPHLNAQPNCLDTPASSPPSLHLLARASRSGEPHFEFSDRTLEDGVVASELRRHPAAQTTRFFGLDRVSGERLALR